MSKELFLNLAGPSITGTVTVGLLELDKMRLDHANAVKIAEELRNREKSVKVIIVEKQNSFDYDRYGRRFITDDKYIELSVDYKNLEDFRSLISQEEREKVTTELNNLNAEINSQAKRIGDLQIKLGNCGDNLKNKTSEFDKLKIIANESAEGNNKADLRIKELLVNNDVLNRVTAAQRIHIKKYMEQAHKWRAAKSFWYRITNWF